MGIGRHLLTSALAPQAVGLHRIIMAELERRPEFRQLAYTEGRGPAIRAIAAGLQRHAPTLRIDDLEGAAEQFMNSSSTAACGWRYSGSAPTRMTWKLMFAPLWICF